MISIIIPIFNQHDMTDECILAIRETTQDYELILVDNGSTPPIKAPFMGFIDVTLIRNDENKGFPAAVNQGIRAAQGDITILLNNDVIVTPGWADRLIGMLDEFSIVGPCTNYATGVQGVTAGIYNTKDELYDEATNWSQHYDGAVEEVNFVIGFCMAFKRKLIDKIGWFDESLWPCSGEEIDFCFRAREAGHKIGVAYGVYVHHFGSQTFEQMQQDGQLIYQDVCRMCDDHLAKKWGADFWERQHVERENDDENREDCFSLAG